MSPDIITLDRFAYTPFGTFGELTVSGWRCFTLEPMWKSNTTNISCIPVGAYILQLGVFRRNTETESDDYPAYNLLDVPGRSNVLIHKGNTSEDTHGCILVGAWLGYIKKRWAITESKVTYDRFMHAMGGVPEAVLNICNSRDLG